MFTRDKLREVASLAENQFNNGIKKGCGGILGFALTRLQPRYLKFEKNISVPAMSEYVVVKITGRGKGKSPKVENYIVDPLRDSQILLPFGETKKSDVDLIFNAAYATSAFP